MKMLNKHLFTAHRQLIYQMTKREITSRYRGSALGMLWSFINPLLMLIVYTFVFSVVFKAKWPGTAEESKSQFAIILFAGMIIHAFYCEVLNLSSGNIVGNSNYVKKVVFPLEILTLITCFAALFNMFISTVVLFLINIILGDALHWTMILTPVVVLPLFILAVGTGWLVSALGVYIRDISQFMGVLTSLLLFLSPVFFSLNSLPAEFRGVIELNPLTFIIEQFRKVFIFGEWPDFLGIAIYTVVSLIFTFISYRIFNKLRKGFADVL
ncbi:ABC transporter permease [Pantoea ananatis]|nr:ABC transporter permease [Pantoea ananatis]